MKRRQTLLAERLRVDAMLVNIQELGKKVSGISLQRWIRDLRKKLCMSQKQLAKRAKITQPQLSQIESGKAKVTVETLRRVFNALFCEILILPLPYENIETIVNKQARLAAQKKLESLMGSMALEGQLPTKDYLDKKIDEVAQDLIRSESTEIWDL
jgi:predicted DNA-binding mobile mystery protein A